MDLLNLILKNRGMTWSDYVAMSDPTHADLLDIDRMADCLDDTFKNQETIVVLPDFDMDGDMSAVILHAGLSELGFKSQLYVPLSTKGYGFDRTDIDAIMAQFPDVKVIITCDVGISEFDSIDYAKSKGLTVLVTDHHVPQAGFLAADVAVNPNRVDDTYANKSICGAHVAWQVLDYYVRNKREDWLLTQQIEQLRVFAGIGTISDMMSLVHENRELVNDSVLISRLLLAYDESGAVNIHTSDVPQFFKTFGAYSEPYKRAFYGLSRLYYTYARQDKPRIRTAKDINATFYGFYVAPLFNSLKRLGGDMSHAFNVFFADLKDQQKHIDFLFETNEKRKELVEHYMEVLVDETERGLQPLAPYIYTSEAPGGILGLLATRLIGESGLPTLVLNGDDMHGYHGSGRSPGWYKFNSRTKQHNIEILASKYKLTIDEVYQLLQDANAGVDDTMTDDEKNLILARKEAAESHLLVKYVRSKRAQQYFVAGHEGAFGFGAKSYKHLQLFKKYLDKDVTEVYDEYIKTTDVEVSNEDFTVAISDAREGDVSFDYHAIYNFMRDLKHIEPFGMDWPEPVVKFRFKGSDVAVSTVGADGTHSRLVFKEHGDFVAMVWSSADALSELNDDDVVEITGNFSWNYFNERWSVNLICNRFEVLT